MALESSVPRSRRAVLAAAFGGLAGFVASAVGQPAPAAAAVGDPLKLGKGATVNNAGTANTSMKTNSSGNALLVTQKGSGSALKGAATAGGGVGVVGQNTGSASAGAGVKGIGGNNDGVYGISGNVNRYGVHGVNTAINGDGVRGSPGPGGTAVIGISPTGYGVFGSSNSTDAIHGESDTGIGVVGSSNFNDGVFGVSAGWGVHGFSNAGSAVFGESPSGWAGDFDGNLRVTDYVQLSEMTAPAGTVNGARLFARDNGGKTELCVVFGTGAVQVIATEP